jgi:hypothetical protein
MKKIAQEMVRVAEMLIESRVQKLMTSELRRILPKMRAQEDVEDPIVYAKFFHPYGSGTWLATEFDGRDEFFGAVDLGMGWELGYFRLSELESIKGPGGVQGIERDQWFDPQPLSKAKRD